MSRNSGGGRKRVTDGHESHFGEGGNPAESLAFPHVTPGQIDPRHCPYRVERAESLHGSPLGEPLDIDDVAVLLGCSAWTVRQKYLPQGLPHLRASGAGEFTFFREQVV